MLVETIDIKATYKWLINKMAVEGIINVPFGISGRDFREIKHEIASLPKVELSSKTQLSLHSASPSKPTRKSKYPV